MTGSTFGIIMIVIAAIAGLAFWEVLVLVSAERPSFRHPHPDRMQGNVRGGVHLGDPRSGAPHDEAVAPSGEPAHPDGRAGAPAGERADGVRTAPGAGGEGGRAATGGEGGERPGVRTPVAGGRAR